MFDKVLVALDFSPYSQKILHRIPEIPGVKEVVLIHVFDATRPSRHGWTHDPEIENAKQLMAEKKAALEALGVKVHGSVDVIVDVITQGSIPQAIVDAAAAHNVSLIVTGARGMNPIRELLLGSVSSAVLRNAATSVLILRPDPAAMNASRHPLFSNLLVPTDFSGPADDVISSLKTLGGNFRATLLHVVSKGENQKQIDEQIAESKARLAALQQDLATAGIMAIPYVRIGDPTEKILSVAEEDDVSLIVMNAHGTDWLRTLLLGSTTFTVARRVTKPILVMRTKHETGKND